MDKANKTTYHPVVICVTSTKIGIWNDRITNHSAISSLFNLHQPKTFNINREQEASVMAINLSKVNAGHEENKRFDFVKDCIERGEIAISFKHPEGNPIENGTIESTKNIEDITVDELTKMYREALLDNHPQYSSYEEYKEEEEDPVDANWAANQIVKFRDLPSRSVVFLYLGNNTVGRIGVIYDDYQLDLGGYFDNRYKYPHVRKVKWIETPSNINRKEFFPKKMQDFLGLPGTLRTLEVERNSESHRFLQLCFGIGSALSDTDDAKLEALLF